MTRLETLKAAREHVLELYAVKNEKGYARFTGSVSDLLAQEIMVATWLLSEDKDDN